MTNLGEDIKQRRDRLGWSLRTLAEETGLSAGFLSQLERNETGVTLENVKKLAEAFRRGGLPYEEPVEDLLGLGPREVTT